MIARAARAAGWAAVLLAFAGPVLAQDTGASADISGRWFFSTDAYDIDPADPSFFCSMTGELTLRATNDPDVFEGELVAYESCGDEQIYEAHQDVAATRDGDRLAIASTLRKVLPSPDTYQPDDFDLTIVHDSLMTGELRSADIAGVVFERRGTLTS